MQTLIELVFDILKSLVDFQEWGRNNSRSIIGESKEDRKVRDWQYRCLIFGIIVVLVVGAILVFVL